MSSQPTTCVFEHPAFAALKRPLFRLTEGDRVPALAIELDGAEAVVPLQSVVKLFDIGADSADGRMLNLIGSALRFVVCLRIGDKLPTEILSGKASWEPSPYHRRAASARLQLQLLAWITGPQGAPPGEGPAGGGPAITADMLAADDPATRPLVQDALRRAAAELGVDGGGPAVAALIEDLAEELSYIEALRERLLERVQALLGRLMAMGQSKVRIAAARRETLSQVIRLAAKGVAEITALFEEVDGQTRDVLAALRNLDQQRSFLRPNRDWLYCTQLAWEKELQAWEGVPPSDRGEQAWKLLDRLYRFVAPRFMAVQEWQKLDSKLTVDQAKAAFVW